MEDNIKIGLKMQAGKTWNVLIWLNLATRVGLL
jgi:hypothetical protein